MKNLIILLIITFSVNISRAQQWTNYTNVSPANSIAIDNNNNLWVGGSGVTKFDGTNWTSYPSTYIRVIKIDPSGNIWAGTDGQGLFKYDGNTWSQYTTADGLVNNTVHAIEFDKSGNIWIGTGDVMRPGQGGISKFNGTEWKNYTVADGLVINDVRSIAIDQQGNKWFGTSAGISKFNDTFWTTYTTSDGLVYNTVRSIFIDETGNKWFGTYGGGLSKFDGLNWETIYNLPDNYVWDIVKDNEGNIWFGTSGGVTMFDGTTWTTLTTADGLIDNNVYSIATDAIGNMWFGTFKGISKFSGFTVNILKKQHEDLQVFPNPSSNTITINYPDFSSKSKTISIKNILGQEVYLEKTDFFKQKTINLSELKNGIYFLRLTIDNKTLVKKIVKRE